MNIQQDARFSRLKVWLQDQLNDAEFQIEPASADASFRRYFRVTQSNQTLIAMDAPPDKEDSHPFVRIAGYLNAIHINAPRVLAENFSEGFFLLSDLGHRHYLSVLNQDNAAQLYADAMQTLFQIQQGGATYLSSLPPYDEALLLREMHLFRDWYLQTHLGLSLSAAQLAVLADAFAFLAGQALSQPRVFVHRDYHSRNLMYVAQAGNNPGVLDFQDAVAGPLTYDLVSLLRDCYIAWPRTQVMAWVADYHRHLHDAGMFREITLEQFVRWFDLMGVQRQLKASGIFARLNHRDGKPGYLNDIPRTLGYILQVAPDYPALHGFLTLLDELAVPARLQQVSA
ncbi:MAG: phosphotransferase [Gammaproteobacteria bacterium]|nr:phosphotransferase [Gammaproteobacteria bacterium]